MAKLLLFIIIIFIVISIIVNFAPHLFSSSSSKRKGSNFGGMRVSPHLWRKLVKLTRDETTAHRLVRNLSIKYPDRDLDWCCEKAIYDLERDRYRR